MFPAGGANLRGGLGRRAEAVAAYRAAIELAGNAAEREFLERELADAELVE